MQPRNEEYRYLRQLMPHLKVKNTIDIHMDKEWLMPHISKEYGNH